MAAPKGLEPLLTGSEPVVLPLYERAIYLVRRPGLEPGTPGLWSRRLGLNQHYLFCFCCNKRVTFTPHRQSPVLYQLS